MFSCDSPSREPAQALVKAKRLCVICSAEFSCRDARTACCSRKCGTLHAHRSRTSNSQARRSRTCKQCGETFRARSPSGKARRGETQEGQYCSRLCNANARRMYANRIEAKHAENDKRRRRLGLRDLGEWSAPVTCRQCGVAFTPRHRNSRLCSKACREADCRASEYARNLRRSNKPSRPCRECAKQFTPRYGLKLRLFCSSRCGKRNGRRAGKLARNARIRGAWVERVDPILVFKRDRWRCKLCKTSTPRRLRGTTDPCAPELDHILPLGLGGAHSYSNCQCLCRMCNGFKGATDLSDLRLRA